MSDNLRVILGLVVIVVGLSWGNWEWSPIVIPSNPTVELDIPKPSSSTLKKVSVISELVTEQDDQVSLAVFNKVFAERVTSYDATSQQVNDIYTQTARKTFDTSLRGKYNGYSSALTDLFKSIMGERDGKLTTEQKEELSRDFSGLAYSFVNTE
jgi:hypothetical protein